MSDQTIHLLVTFDTNYIPPFQTMLTSAVQNTPGRKFHVWLLHSAIPQEDLTRLSGFCQTLGVPLTPLVMDRRLFADAPISNQYPQEMYYRLLSPLILPREVERVLYLDPDMLIINPLRPLWEMDLYGKAFAAASHTGLTEMANGINQMRLDTEHEYFNSGVMLIDLTAARKLVTAEDVFACVSEHEKELILPDQDVFNILYGKETRPVEDVLWNYDVRNYSKYLIRSTGKHDLSWVMRNTAVLHFCGRNKPWHEDYKNPFGMLYLHYMNLTLRKRYA